MKNKILRKIQYYIAILSRSSKTGSTIKLLAKNVDENIRKLAGSLSFFRENTNWSKIEKESLLKVDAIRTNYRKSTKQVLVEDYGAGNSCNERTKEEMAKGVAEYSMVSAIYKECSSPDKWGKLIFKLIRDLKPINCLELGTCLGISTIYQLLALQLNNSGKLLTIEGSPELAKIAGKELDKMKFKNYSIQTGKFIDVLPDLLKTKAPFDFVFVDGHHDQFATTEYFELIYPHLSNTSFIIFDDINWSDGMKAFWKNLSTDNRIILTLDLYKWGICYINKKNSTNKVVHYKLYN